MLLDPEVWRTSTAVTLVKVSSATAPWETSDSVSTPSPPVITSPATSSALAAVTMTLPAVDPSMVKVPAFSVTVLSPSPRITVVRQLAPALSPSSMLLDPAAWRTSTAVMLVNTESAISPSLVITRVSTPPPPMIVSAPARSALSAVTRMLDDAEASMANHPAVWVTVLSPSPRRMVWRLRSPLAAFSPRVTLLEPVTWRISMPVLLAKRSSLTSPSLTRRSVSVPVVPVKVSAVARSALSMFRRTLAPLEPSIVKAPAVWLRVLFPSPRTTVVRPFPAALSASVMLLDPAA